MGLQKARSLVDSRLISWFLLFVLYWITATASVSGFLGKWALRDSAPTYGIEQLLDGTAIKPFAYRIFLPKAADLAERITPQNVKTYVVDKLGPYRTFARATSSEKAPYAFRYVVIVYLCLAACLASLFVLRAILIDLDFSRQTAASVPIMFMLAFPFVQTIGGYPYDYPEVFFLATAVLMALRNRWLLLCLMAIPATLNKEAFFFFLPALYPFLRAHSSRNVVFSVLALVIGISGLVNVAVKWVYRDAGGDAAHFQLMDNLVRYLSPSTYRQVEVTYGFVGPSGAFIGTVFLLAAIVVRGWRYCPVQWRTHLMIASLINFPLFLLFCAPGEMRNLSLTFVGFIVLIACVVEKSVAHSPGLQAPTLPRDGFIDAVQFAETVSSER
jgi:hypothetical protein